MADVRRSRKWPSSPTIRAAARTLPCHHLGAISANFLATRPLPPALYWAPRRHPATAAELKKREIVIQVANNNNV